MDQLIKKKRSINRTQGVTCKKKKKEEWIKKCGTYTQ